MAPEHHGMRILFLDFDGVLNTPATWGNHVKEQHQALDRDKVERVSRFCNEHNLMVVISSTWRRFAPLNGIRYWLSMQGWTEPERIIDYTDFSSWSRSRRREIEDWMDIHAAAFKISAYVVLDDDTGGDGLDPDTWDELVLVSPDTGVTESNLDRALTILNDTAAPDSPSTIP